MPVLNRVAQAAEIQAAKHNWERIPMCHPLPLMGIDSSFHLSDQPCMVEIRAAVTCIGVTGVDSATPEMCGQAIYPATVMQGEKEESAARRSIPPPSCRARRKNPPPGFPGAKTLWRPFRREMR